VLLVAGAPAPEPAGVAPKVRIVAPSMGQAIPEAGAASFVVKLDVKSWPIAPTRGRVHLVLDGRAVHSLANLDQPIDLGALIDATQGAAPDAGASLAAGAHVLAAVLARADGESLKSKDALAVTEFSVGSRTAASFDPKEPYLVVSEPHGAYADANADHVLVDFVAVGATLGDGKQSIALALEGPGVEGSLMATTTRLVPYYLENLRAGAYTVRLQILGADGKPLSAPQATASRSLTVTRSARTEEPKGPEPATPDDRAADAGGADHASDAGDGGRASGTRRIRPPPLKTKPVIQKPKPPAPPVKPKPAR
jgi:hypothetical protein